jgi:hypothetical protein
MVDRWAQTAVNAEDGVVDDDAEGEKVKHVGKVLPDGWRAVFASTFEVEAIRLKDQRYLKSIRRGGASDFRSLNLSTGFLKEYTANASTRLHRFTPKSPLLN